MVAPLAGAWIETFDGFAVHVVQLVAPLAGAWIETRIRKFNGLSGKVAPLAGAWIETTYMVGSMSNHGSLPSRERGLKQL